MKQKLDDMIRTRIFDVAGHLFSVEMEENWQLWQHLTNYEPFELAPKGEDEAERLQTVFRLQIVRMPDENWPSAQKQVAEFDDDGSYICLYESGAEELRFGMSDTRVNRDRQSGLVLNLTTGEAVLFLHPAVGRREAVFAVNNALMLLYAVCTARKNTLLMHASVTVCEGKGYVFLGRSGTGKSTHSRLWLSAIEGTELLNDDNPVIRTLPEGVYVYGTPWSGKTPCYRNRKAALGAIVRLSQAPFNRIERLKGVAAYAAVSPSASAMKWRREYADGLHRTLVDLVGRCGVYHLQCLPDKEAALLCHDTVGRNAE